MWQRGDINNRYCLIRESCCLTASHFHDADSTSSGRTSFYCALLIQYTFSFAQAEIEQGGISQICRIPEVVVILEYCLGYEVTQSCLHMARQGGGVLQQILVVDDDARLQLHRCSTLPAVGHRCTRPLLKMFRF